MAHDTVNDQDALAIGSKQSKQFSVSLSSNSHTSIKRKVKSTEALKKAVIVKGKLIYDVETLFSRLLVLGQQRSVDVAEIFQFKLSPVPTALIDESSCLRKGNKAMLLKSMCSCMCSDKILTTLVGVLKVPPSSQPSQQGQLLSKHSKM